jgi:hypothetical protein
MKPYIVGTSALRTENVMGYDPVNFKRMRLNPSTCLTRVSQDPQRNALFEVICDETVVMAFQFLSLRPWELNQKRDAFARIFAAGKKDPALMYLSVLPTQNVPVLPSYPVWDIHSTLGETGFWARNDFRLSVHSNQPKTSIVSFATETGVPIASFEISGFNSDDADVLDAAMDLRSKLRSKYPIRIETVWEHEKLVWFHPATHVSI